MAAFAKLSGALLSPRMSDWWNPGLRKRMLSDSGLGIITPHYEDSYMKDLSHSRVLRKSSLSVLFLCAPVIAGRGVRGALTSGKDSLFRGVHAVS